MGDRGNIIIKEPDGGEVFLYTHWERYKAVDNARTALAKRWRWDDESYLARIIFDVMTEDAHGDETGFGISTRIGDGDRTVVVDVATKTVTTPGGTFTFEEFITQPNEEI